MVGWLVGSNQEEQQDLVVLVSDLERRLNFRRPFFHEGVMGEQKEAYFAYKS